jgi:hypothetical protein
VDAAEIREAGRGIPAVRM